MNPLEITNASKAQVIAFVNAVIGLLVAFELVELSTEQLAAVATFVNLAAGAFVALTYKMSPKRLPDGVEADEVVSEDDAS